MSLQYYRIILIVRDNYKLPCSNDFEDFRAPWVIESRGEIKADVTMNTCISLLIPIVGMAVLSTIG